MNQTIEFGEEMAEVEKTCETEHDVSILYKFISILVSLNEFKFSKLVLILAEVWCSILGYRWQVFDKNGEGWPSKDKWAPHICHQCSQVSF